MSTKPTHLTLGGGGFAALVYMGFCRYMQTDRAHFSDVHGVSGTSMGAFFAVVIAMGIPAAEIEDDMLAYLLSREVQRFPTSSFRALLQHYGLDDGERLVGPLRKWAAHKYGNPKLTFMDLVKRCGVDVRICATSLRTGEAVFFSVDTTPDVDVMDAVKASMAVPFLVQPVCIAGEYYVDGGLAQHIPISAFPKVPIEQILVVSVCVKMVEAEGAVCTAPEGLFGYTTQILGILAKNFFVPATFPHQLVFDAPPVGCFPLRVCKEGVDLCLEKEGIDACIAYGFSTSFAFFRQTSRRP